MEDLEKKYGKILEWEFRLSTISVLGGAIGIGAAALNVRDHGYQATFSGCGIKVGVVVLGVTSLGTYVTSLMKECINNQIERLNFQAINTKLDDIKSIIQTPHRQVDNIVHTAAQVVKSIGPMNIIRTAYNGLSGSVEACVTYYLVKTVDEAEKRVARAAAGMILINLWNNQLQRFIHTAVERSNWKKRTQRD